MFQLPFEILVHIFSYLSKSDLLQCQLTSKEWYESSVELLYSNPIIDLSNTSRLFVRTLSNSSRLSSYIKTINTRELFKTRENKFWDEHGLLDVLIRQCPNLLDLNSWEQGSSFWTQLSFAATRGQLSRLQSLPSANSEDLESYIYTALLFKASLTHLSVKDDLIFFGPDMNCSKAYQILQNEISEFKNLRSLSISCTSNKQLSSFDTLIEDCSNLKKICITLDPTVDQRMPIIKNEKIFQPRPDIRQLICNWKTVNNEIQLKYIMQKFPNLQHLVISSMFHKIGDKPSTNCTANALIEFLRFIMNIPYFSMELQVRKEDLPNIWIRLMNMDDRYRNVTIDGFSDDRYLDNVELSIQKTSSVITFAFHNSDDELPPIKFFDKAGSMIRSLNIRDMTNLVPMVDESSIHYRTLAGIDWIFQTIELCPSLQELTIPSAWGYDRSNRPTFQQTELKKLLVYNILDPHYSILFLKLMSMNLPNIQQLQLEFDSLFVYDSNKPITILMPNTKLNLLSSTNPLSVFSNFNSSIIEVYIRLDTDIGAKYYIGKGTGLITINEQHYNKSQEKIRFDITCRSLKEFEIIEENRGPFSCKLKWSF